MAEKTYGELLKDPRWQRKRLEILSRDEFTCLSCGDKESTLHVHHKHYRRGARPWEYDSAYLVTLCENCHEAITVDSKAISELINDYGPRGADAARQLLETFFGEESAVQRNQFSLERVLSFIRSGK